MEKNTFFINSLSIFPLVLKQLSSVGTILLFPQVGGQQCQSTKQRFWERSGLKIVGEINYQAQAIVTSNTIRKWQILFWGPKRLPSSTAIWIRSQSFSAILDSTAFHRFFFSLPEKCFPDFLCFWFLPVIQIPQEQSISKVFWQTIQVLAKTPMCIGYIRFL